MPPKQPKVSEKAVAEEFEQRLDAISAQLESQLMEKVESKMRKNEAQQAQAIEELKEEKKAEHAALKEHS